MRMAIIPARGGSKRIPGKNTRFFCGKPLISYSIEAAKKSGLFDKIIVSTDSAEVARVAIAAGAEVPFMRPASLSDDYTGTHPVTNHAIGAMIDAGYDIDLACCIYATAPMLQPEYLEQGLRSLQAEPGKAYAFSVTSFAFPVQRALMLDGTGVAPMFPAHIDSRSQDLTEAYHDAGQFYWGRARDYLANKAMFARHSVPVILPRHLVQDIDTEEDWQRAELMYRALQQSDKLNG